MLHKEFSAFKHGTNGSFQQLDEASVSKVLSYHKAAAGTILFITGTWVCWSQWHTNATKLITCSPSKTLSVLYMQSTLTRACVHNHLHTLTHTHTQTQTHTGVQVGGPRWVKSLAQAVTKQQVQLCHMREKIGHVQSWWATQDWGLTESVCALRTIFKCVCVLPCLTHIM